MTAYPRRSGGLVALVAALVVAACGSTPVTSPTATTGPSPTATAAPTVAPSSTPTDAPTSSPTAALCDDSVVGGPAATPGPDDPSAATYTEIERQVEELRALRATTPVARGVFDTASLCAYLRDGFRSENPPELISGTERLYKELGLLARDASLEALYLELLTSQVAGLYDDETKHMYVVSKDGAIGPLEEITYAHEYTHALQDQAFVLRSVVGEETDQSDATMARLSVVEGDATLLMTIWAQRNLTAAELGQVAGSVDPAAQAVLDRMPPILKDPLEFPYLNGLQLALQAFTNGGNAAVDALFADPPDSTEQVLHPEKFATREPPVVVAFPDDLAATLGTGWTVSLQDTFGEMLLDVVLRDGGATDSAQAAAGWGGDRVALLEGPDGEAAVVLDTAWDSADDAGEFATALDALVAKLQGLGSSVGVFRPAPDRVVLVSASGTDSSAADAVLSLVANVLGLAG